MTQRGLSPHRTDPVTTTGHADLVADADGNWWAVFLATRPYAYDFHNTGRETYPLPVDWRDGWPMIQDGSQSISGVLERPSGEAQSAPEQPLTGNFTVHEEFGSPLDHYWLFVRVPQDAWWKVSDGTLRIEARRERIGDLKQPSAVLRRQQHLNAVIETSIRFSPQTGNDEAGLVALQNDAYYFALGIGQNGDGRNRY